MSPSSGIRANFPECVDIAPTVSQFTPGLCGCGFELRKFLHEEREVKGPHFFILMRLDPFKDSFKRCRRSSVEEQMLPQATKVRKSMKKKKLDRKGKVKGKF